MAPRHLLEALALVAAAGLSVVDGRIFVSPFNGGCDNFACPAGSLCKVFGGVPNCITEATCIGNMCRPDQECKVINNLERCVPLFGCESVRCPENQRCFVDRYGRGNCVPITTTTTTRRTTTTTTATTTTTTTAAAPTTTTQPPTTTTTPEPTTTQKPQPKAQSFAKLLRSTLPSAAERQRRACESVQCGKYKQCELVSGRARCVTSCGNLQCASNHCILSGGELVCAKCTLTCPVGRICQFVGPSRIRDDGDELPKQQRCLRPSVAQLALPIFRGYQ